MRVSGPIETQYAGCRFRSRLEARWAVLFDWLGLRWEYETQGFELSDPWGASSFRYLPDFWLPESGLWVEVKGEFEPSHLQKLCWAARPHSGLPKDPRGEHLNDNNRNRPRILLLWNIPRIHTEWGAGRGVGSLLQTHPLHYCLRHHKGDVSLEPFWFQPQPEPARWTDGFDHLALWSDAPDGLMDPADACATIMDEDFFESCSMMPRVVQRAYEVARSARFEFGETPPQPPGALP